MVEEHTYTGPVSGGDDSRRDHDAKTTLRYHSYRVSDGALLGSFAREGFTLLGSAKERVWMCGARGEPLLLSTESMQVVADRSAMSAALGGDFETGARCYINAYTGSLAVTLANGERYWLGANLGVEPRPSDTVIPKGWYCATDQLSLVEPKVSLCLSPEATPASALVVSNASALAKDAKQSELLSGVAGSFGQHTRVLWTSSLAELAESGEEDTPPMWLGATQLDAHRVAVLMRSEKLRVHVLILDPASGSVLERTRLFNEGVLGK